MQEQVPQVPPTSQSRARQELENFVDRTEAVPAAGATPHEALQLSEDATWQEIEAKFQELKNIFKKQRLDITDDEEGSLSALYADAQPLFSQVYQAYEKLRKDGEFAQRLFLGNESIPSILESLHILEMSSIPFVYGENGQSISVAGARKNIDMVLRLAITRPREDVDPVYLTLIPVDFGWRQSMLAEIQEVQQLIVELEEGDNLARIFGLLDTLLSKGYRYLPKIDLGSEKKYLVDIANEREIVKRQMKVQEKAENVPFFLAGIKKRNYYQFSGKPRPQ